jgi:sigma-B regulation protein RsbU (phosphoserine phosphatase)
MDDSVFIENEDYYLKPGQILILGTDGIWEAINSEGVFFGKDRLKKVISTTQTSSANEIAKSIFEAVKDFTGSDSQEDDLTIMIVKRLNK